MKVRCKASQSISDLPSSEHTKRHHTMLSLVANVASDVTLATFDGSMPDLKFVELNDPVMGGKSTGTWSVDAAKHVGVFDGTVLVRRTTHECHITANVAVPSRGARLLRPVGMPLQPDVRAGRPVAQGARLH